MTSNVFWDATNTAKHEPGFKHGELSGGTETAKTAKYPEKLCRTYFAALFGAHQHAPCMPCLNAGEAPYTDPTEHREKKSANP